jgi:Na+/H+ antiporter NhaA
VTIIEKVALRAKLHESYDLETVKTIAIFCGVGLAMSLFLAMSGLDVTVALF